MYVKNLGKISVALAAAPALGGPALAAEPPAVPVASSYAELLEPIPDAAQKLKLADLQAAQRPARLIPAEWGNAHHHHHHHHHHHNNYWAAPYSYGYGGSPYYYQPYNYSPYYGGGYYQPYAYRRYYNHHHHHHHHHHNNYRRW